MSEGFFFIFSSEFGGSCNMVSMLVLSRFLKSDLVLGYVSVSYLVWKDVLVWCLVWCVLVWCLV